MRDLIDDGRNGFLVDVGDHEAIIRKMRKLWEDPALASSISTAARETAGVYTWERFASELTSFYGKLLDLRQKGCL